MAELIQKTDTLNQGREKLNTAITDAETAKNISEQADDKATQALTQSESTQTQLDTIVINGDSSVEAAQARVDTDGQAHATLKARLDAEHTAVTSQLADIVEVNIKEYSHLVADEDWKPALEAALADGDRIYFPKGRYSLNTTNIPSNKTIYGDGDNTIFQPMGLNLFRAYGSIGDEVKITSNIEDFSNTATVSDSSAFEEHDDVVLIGQRDCLTYADSGSNWTLGYATPNSQGLYFGEFLEIDYKAGNTLYFKSNTIFPFYLNNNLQETAPTARESSTIQKVSFCENVIFENFKIEQSGGTAIAFLYAKNCYVNNINMGGDGYTDGMIQFIDFRRSLNCEAKNCSFGISHSVSPTQHHYINIYKAVSSMYCGFTNCRAFNTTQPFDISYATKFIPATGCFIDDCKVSRAHQTGMTSHGGTYQSRFTDNVISGVTQGIACRTRNSIITNNILIGSFDSSTNLKYGIGLYEGHAVDCVVANNTVTNFHTGIIVADASDVGESFRYCGALITDNTIKNFKYGVRVLKSAHFLKEYMGINITNNTFNPSVSNAIQCVRLEEGTNGVYLKGNLFNCMKADIDARAIYANYDVTNIYIVDTNVFRQFSTAIFIRGIRSGSSLSQVNYVESGNDYVDVNTKVNVGNSTAKRKDITSFKGVRFVETSAFSDIVENNILFIYIDGNLYFKDNSGMTHKITSI